MKFKIIPSAAQYYFNIIASNGQVLATSERYTTKANVRLAIASIKAQASGASTEE